MKTLIYTIALSLLVAANSATASVQLGDGIKLSRGSNQGSAGGVFDVDDLNDAGVLNFKTFCAEVTEHISFGPTYYVYCIWNGTTQGGKTLGTMAAWYYTQFREGDIVLSGAHQENAMQLGIWRSMGYSDGDVLSAIGGQANWNAPNYITSVLNPILNGWTTSLALDLAAWVSHGAGYIGGVQVINLASALDSNGRPLPGTYSQDQLIWSAVTEPDGEPGVVPEPGTIAIWGALLGLGLIAKRRTVRGI